MTQTGDLLSLFDFVGWRFTTRMRGLDDDELDWQPTEDGRISPRGRLGHVTEAVGEARCAAWLGLPDGGGAMPDAPTTVAVVITGLDTAYQRGRGLVDQLDDAQLAGRIGPVGQDFAEDSHRSFVLPIADGLVHHCAEAALFRDLYEHRT